MDSSGTWKRCAATLSAYAAVRERSPSPPCLICRLHFPPLPRRKAKGVPALTARSRLQDGRRRDDGDEGQDNSGNEQNWAHHGEFVTWTCRCKEIECCNSQGLIYLFTEKSSNLDQKRWTMKHSMVWTLGKWWTCGSWFMSTSKHCEDNGDGLRERDHVRSGQRFVVGDGNYFRLLGLFCFVLFQGRRWPYSANCFVCYVLCDKLGKELL